MATFHCKNCGIYGLALAVEGGLIMEPTACPACGADEPLALKKEDHPADTPIWDYDHLKSEWIPPTRALLDRHAELLSELRGLHLGRVQHEDIDPQERERQLHDSIAAIGDAIGEIQMRQQQHPDTRDGKTKMTELALRFPSISIDTPGIHPWDAISLNKWADCGGASSGERCTAEFLLYVWNPFDGELSSGRFDFADAIKTWDIFHLHAFLTWAEDPFWP